MARALAGIGIGGIQHRPAAPVLQLTGVSLIYPTAAKGGQPEAITELSFRVQQGQRVAVVGPNGAGKSTLLKLIAGLTTATAGAVEVYGHGPGDHICIGYVPQRSQIDWTFPATAEEVVMMGRVGRIGLLRWPRKRDWDIVHTSLARVGATHLKKEQIGELSGGQQQRVFLARALAQEAELLLLDEPLAGLDGPSREAIFDILNEMSSDGATVLLATHDLQLASEHFDRVLLLNRRLIAFAEPADALSQENLLAAYSGQAQILPGEGGTMVLADTCCDHGESEVFGQWSALGGHWVEAEKLKNG